MRPPIEAPEYERIDWSRHQFVYREAGVRFLVSGLQEDSKTADVRGIVQVDLLNKAGTVSGNAYRGRIFLLGSRTTEDGVKACVRDYPDRLDWPLAFKGVAWKLFDLFFKPEPAQRIKDVPLVPFQYAIEMLAPLNEPTVFHGDGGSFKSFWVGACAVALATGRQFGPIKPVVPAHPVLYLDWETRAETHRRRFSRLCAGLGLPGVPDNIWYQRQEVSLLKSADKLRALADEIGAGTVIIDSIAWALGGDVTAELVIPTTAALRTLGERTIFIINHVSAASAQQPKGVSRGYGSVFLRNAARKTWEVRQGRSRSPDNITIQLTNEKVNDGPQDPVIYANIHFQDPDGPITLKAGEAGDNDELAARLSTQERIRLHLKDVGKDTTKNIAAAVDAGEETVFKTLQRMELRKDVVRLEVVSGKATTWGLAAPEPTNLRVFPRQDPGHPVRPPRTGDLEEEVVETDPEPTELPEDADGVSF